jgi:hypothetical protein
MSELTAFHGDDPPPKKMGKSGTKKVFIYFAVFVPWQTEKKESGRFGDLGTCIGEIDYLKEIRGCAGNWVNYFINEEGGGFS